MPNIKITAKGSPVSSFSFPGGATRPLPRQLRYWLFCNGFNDGSHLFSHFSFKCWDSVVLYIILLEEMALR